MARQAKLTEADRLKLRDLQGKILPHGTISRLAGELNVSTSTVWKYVNGQAGGSLPKRPRPEFPVGSSPGILGEVPEELPRELEAESADPNLRVLRELRDDPGVAPADRVRAALALMGQGPGDDEAWSPPTSQESWADILVEILKVQPEAVKARIWEGRPPSIPERS